MWIRYNGHLRLLIGIIHSVRLPISDTARDVTFKRPEERKRGEEKKKKKTKKALQYSKKNFTNRSFSFHVFISSVWINDEIMRGEQKERKKERREDRKKERKIRIERRDFSRRATSYLGWYPLPSWFSFFFLSRTRKKFMGNENAVFEDSGKIRETGG